VESKNNKLHYGYIIVLSVFLQMFIAGTPVLTSSLFVLPVTESFHISQGEFMMYMSIQYIFMAIASVFVPKLLSKFKYTTLDRAGIIIMASGVGIMGLARNVLLLYIGGAMIGTGQVVVMFLCAGTLIPRWFKVGVGAMLATANLGYSAGGIIMSPVISRILDMDSVLGMEPWRGTYILLAGAFIVLAELNSILLMRNEPSEKGLQRFGEIVEASSPEKAPVVVISGVSKSVAIKSSSFIWLVIMMMAWNFACQIQVYLAPYATFTTAAATSGFDLKGFIGSVAMIGSVVGGYLVGGANDKFGGKGGSLVAGICGVVACVMMLAGQANSIVILIGAALFGIYYVVGSVQLPVMITSMYGDREYSKLFPFAAAFCPWFGAVSSSLWGFLYDMTGTYSSMLIGGIVLCALTSITGVIAISNSKKLKSQIVSEEITITK